MTTFLSLLFSILAMLSATRGILAVDYDIDAATMALDLFKDKLVFQDTMNTMSRCSDFILKTFNQDSPPYDGRKRIDLVTLFIDDTNKQSLAYVLKNEIHYNKSYLTSYEGDVKLEFTGIMYTMMTAVWQWYDAFTPPNLITGMGDFMRMKANFTQTGWRSRGDGDKWDQDSEVTAFFLDYCNDLMGGRFISELNKKMKDGYSDVYFYHLLNKTLDQLWKDYKAKYSTAN